MKKTLLLAAAALFATANAMAVDMYVIGANVNGASWTLGAADALMKETSTGVYEWSGKVLGSGFKFNDGTWNNDAYNFGAPEGATTITLDTPFKYEVGGGSKDITLPAGVGQLNDPTVVLNLNAGTVTVSGTPGQSEPVDPGTLTFYIVGDNANGHNWSVKEEDCAFEDQGNGIYVWKGNVLGTGFKVTAGAWGDHEMCTNGSEMVYGQPYYYSSTGDNIGFDGFTLLNDPVIELNINEETLTIIGGEKEGEYHWYIYNLNGVGGSTPDEAGNNELAPTDEEGVFELKNFAITEQAGTFKISSTGWAKQLGTNNPEENFISPDRLEVELEDVGSEGMIDYELIAGLYNIVFDYNEYYVAFSHASDDAVDAIVVGNASNTVYYNLHGQKVANPDKGIYVKVVNGKAVKVVK